MSKRSSDRTTRAVFGTGALALAVCCGSHLLAFGAIGALAAGGLFGVLAGVIVAAFAVIAVVLLVRRRRRAASCAVAGPVSPSRGISRES